MFIVRTFVYSVNKFFTVTFDFMVFTVHESSFRNFFYIHLSGVKSFEIVFKLSSKFFPFGYKRSDRNNNPLPIKCLRFTKKTICCFFNTIYPCIHNGQYGIYFFFLVFTFLGQLKSPCNLHKG
ncbi:MAG: hypothetical protein AMQ22_01042 [Candidatus Methanofastidiosum methylothiophilum]|uniref:Uncharacterized protein n=1 Tax=Candidatus Methanofastidiosum methylothiophilum TaxID=1705564 RepID=A0A150J4A1_9EURY|nr:MAG: hypothetical protein AMQ22_01042 [Candidatus Methanofastidiosum methylthiophilus]